MNESKLNEYLVISRGQWDADASPETIQTAIDQFYDWLDAHVAAGNMRRGSRLTREVALGGGIGLRPARKHRRREQVGAGRARLLERAVRLGERRGA